MQLEVPISNLLTGGSLFTYSTTVGIPYCPEVEGYRGNTTEAHCRVPKVDTTANACGNSIRRFTLFKAVGSILIEHTIIGAVQGNWCWVHFCLWPHVCPKESNIICVVTESTLWVCRKGTVNIYHWAVELY